jgi:hypothetical protein
MSDPSNPSSPPDDPKLPPELRASLGGMQPKFSMIRRPDGVFVFPCAPAEHDWHQDDDGVVRCSKCGDLK